MHRRCSKNSRKIDRISTTTKIFGQKSSSFVSADRIDFAMKSFDQVDRDAFADQFFGRLSTLKTFNINVLFESLVADWRSVF